MHIVEKIVKSLCLTLIATAKLKDKMIFASNMFVAQDACFFRRSKEVEVCETVILFISQAILHPATGGQEHRQQRVA